MRIVVTQKDIERGVAGTCAACPIARAVRRQTDQPWQIGFGNRVAAENLGRPHAFLPGTELPEMPKVWLAPELRQFIVGFDLGGAAAVKPFEFDADFEQFGKVVVS